MEIDRLFYQCVIQDEVPLNTNNLIVSPFINRQRASISINNYITRILKYVQCSDTALVVAIIYIKRLYDRFGEEFYNQHSFHRLYITSIVVASKFIDDWRNNNKFYAVLGGITVRELKKLEISFLSYISFDLFVSCEEYKEAFNGYRPLKMLLA